MRPPCRAASPARGRPRGPRPYRRGGCESGSQLAGSTTARKPAEAGTAAAVCVTATTAAGPTPRHRRSGRGISVASPGDLVQRLGCRARGCRRPRGKSRGACLADRPARLFVCAGCRAQVVLCSRCDRGQRYCQRACAERARRSKQREAGQRYQCSPMGRLKHAARQRCLRRRRRQASAPGAGMLWRSVTHQGSLPAGCDAVLPACAHDSVEPHPAPAASEDAASAWSPLVPAGATPAPQRLRCTRCAAALSPWLRQGFLRRRRVPAGAHLAAWPPRPRSHSP